MKKAITLITNDWHIKPSNTETILSLIRQKIELAKSLNIEKVFVLGDIFESRQSQPLITLKCFEDCLDLFNEAKITLIAIPGNHDKTNYCSVDSFLDAFSWHPALSLITEGGYVKINDIKFRLIPFFDDSMWVRAYEKSVEKIALSKNDVLLSHIAVNGSVNNDGTKVEKSINPALLKGHEAVFLGHYHNMHKVGSNIYHLPSMMQKDHSEDENKGFTIVYEDASFETHKANFKKFKTIEVNLDEMSAKEMKSELSKLDPNDINYRLIVKGSSEKIKAVKTEELKMMGFAVKTEQNDIRVSIEEVQSGEIIEFNDTTILEEFEKFCKLESYDEIEKGKSYLTKKLKNA